jgi:hypothetical protein
MMNYGRNIMDKKKLYAVLWIDDFGSLKLRKGDIEWYHENAGPISYALEWDDQYPWSLDDVLNKKADFSDDYLAYHYHPIMWKGSGFPKRIYDRLKLHSKVYTLLRAYQCVPYSKTLMRLRNISILTIISILALITLFNRSNTIAANLLLLLLCFLFGLFIVWYYVRLPGNWEIKISDAEWNKKFILNSKTEIEKRGFMFPKIVRHGWNLPWKGSAEFYMSLGIIADASAVPMGPDKKPKIAEREIEWMLSQPYFTSLRDDYDIPWDGLDERNRGLLELPVTLGNFSLSGFGDREKAMIKQIPEGGLIGAYIHPQDDFKPIKEWVFYLKKNYDVEFVDADHATKMSMDKIKKR